MVKRLVIRFLRRLVEVLENRCTLETDSQIVHLATVRCRKQAVAKEKADCVAWRKR